MINCHDDFAPAANGTTGTLGRRIDALRKTFQRRARRRALRTACAVVSVVGMVFGAGLLPAHAEGYPNKPIKLVVGFPPGGANDVLARQLAPRLSAALNGASIVVVNIGGADGMIGSAYVSHAAPDGYTIDLAGLSSVVLSKFTYKDVPYDPVKGFSGISTVASSPVIYAVKPSSNIHSFKELIDYAKAHPGKLNFGVVGTGGWTRMVFEQFKLATGVNINMVPYKGGSEALTDLLGGRLDGMAIDFPVLYPMVKQGKLIGLAMSGKKRSPLLPDLATVQELGYSQLTLGNWYALLAPPNTPSQVVARLSQAVATLAASEDTQKMLVSNGMEGFSQPTPAAFVDFVNSEIARWGKVVQAAHISAN